MNVRFIYHPYAETMTIFMDGKSIGMISALSKFQSQPFSAWCESILPEVALEVNDNFDLTYVGRRCEYDMLKQHIAQCPSCTSIKYEQPSLPDTTLQRLKKLSRMSSSGVVCAKFSRQLHVYSDFDSAAIEEMVRSAIPRLSFCRINVVVAPLSAIAQEKDCSSAIAIVDHSYVRMESIAQYVFGCIHTNMDQEGCINGMFLLSGNRDALREDVAALLELGYYPALLKEAISRTQPPANGPMYSELYVLDKIEPQVIARLPRSIEIGETAPIQVFTVPSGGTTPEITCRISNNSVVTHSAQGLKAVGTGEAVVEVYEVGRSTPLCKGTVTAYRRNRIAAITAAPTQLRMCVGDTARIQYRFEPNDADNLSSLRLISQKPSVAEVKGLNTVCAVSSGVTSISYEAERITSNRCEVMVYPKLERIDLEMDSTNLKIGSMTSLRIRRYPEDAKLDNLSVRVDPPRLGTYENGSGRFFAREGGDGHIIVESDRGTKASLPIHVKQPPLLNNGQIIKLAAAIIGAIAVWKFIISIL